MFSVIEGLGGEVQDVFIAEFDKHTYYANLRILRDGQLVLVDLRPSDAFAIALLADKPILLSDHVLSKIGVQ
jgi:bifunctional DNase/RNase